MCHVLLISLLITLAFLVLVTLIHFRKERKDKKWHEYDDDDGPQVD